MPSEPRVVSPAFSAALSLISRFKTFELSRCFSIDQSSVLGVISTASYVIYVVEGTLVFN